MAVLTKEREMQTFVKTKPRFGKTLFAAPSAVKPLSLDDLIVGVRDELVAGRTVKCVVCDGSMRPIRSQSRSVRGGQCRNCGSRLS